MTVAVHVLRVLQSLQKRERWKKRAHDGDVVYGG